ncbi:hypothetical protein RFI_28821 [Reticulomyxa filosa]|uniref:C2 domain-containing protein n=1 Tax=Reticulomyxa filosa TaxID=46433 RepID=X6M527_RETFI|nr:hypothetical protein RFI_28821 [Reticulomyxa filosa]|eukprot:ETO08567.1 hypothetical protein RFI_28821 [Reticulomyxa filosa]
MQFKLKLAPFFALGFGRVSNKKRCYENKGTPSFIINSFKKGNISTKYLSVAFKKTCQEKKLLGCVTSDTSIKRFNQNSSSNGVIRSRINVTASPDKTPKDTQKATKKMILLRSFLIFCTISSTVALAWYLYWKWKKYVAGRKNGESRDKKSIKESIEDKESTKAYTYKTGTLQVVVKRAINVQGSSLSFEYNKYNISTYFLFKKKKYIYICIHDMKENDKDDIASFVKAKVGGKKFKTRVIRRNKNPVWEDSRELKCDNVLEQVLTISLYEQEPLGMNHLIGTSEIDLNWLIRERDGKLSNHVCDISNLKTKVIISLHYSE